MKNKTIHILLTISSIASLMAVINNTKIKGTAVVIGVNDDMNGMS